MTVPLCIQLWQNSNDIRLDDGRDRKLHIYVVSFIFSFSEEKKKCQQPISKLVDGVCECDCVNKERKKVM